MERSFPSRVTFDSPARSGTAIAAGVKIPYAELLDVFGWGVDALSRHDCHSILAGLRACDTDRHAQQLLGRLERQRLIARQGRGRHATFRITTAGRQRVTVTVPTAHWDKPWDGKWRVFNYDLPETRRKDRIALCRALHACKFGLLQRSLWVWPHEAEAILRRIVDAQGIPECFCGFQSERLFLCDDAEVVETAWDFAEVGRRHQLYLQHAAALLEGLKAARTLKEVARVARREHTACQEAFLFDPLLPRTLWPPGYRGEAVDVRHRQFRAVLRQRVARMAESANVTLERNDRSNRE
jgi:DNA-binding transcriptional regulator PaaX